MAKNSNTHLALVAIDGEIAFSRSDVWAYYRVPTTSYEFMSHKSRQHLGNDINRAIEGVLINPQKGVDLHLIVTSSPLDVDTWRDAMVNRVDRWNPAPGFDSYLDSMYDYLNEHGFMEKEVYLGVHLGRRSGAYSENTSLSAFFKSITSVIDDMLKMSDAQIPDKEITHWRNKARDYTRALGQGHLKATPATAGQVARLVKQTMYPGMPVPPVSESEHQRWGSGEIFALGESFIENNRKFLKITQTDNYGQDMTGYRATLCVSRFPDVLHENQEPWIYLASSLGFNVNFFSRFRVEPAEKVRKDIGKKLQSAKDQAINATSGGGQLPIGLQEQLATAQELQHSLDRERAPWIYGRYYISVEAETEDQLRDQVQNVIAAYADLGIEVTWPSGDQFNLLLASHPADKIRLSAYEQRQSLSAIAGGMPTASSAVGDRINESGNGWVGPYLGWTTSRIALPFFYGPHVAISQNNPPGLLITGAPGGGKSFTAFTLTCQMAMQGIWCIYIDPKADALPIANLSGLGNVNVFDLAQGADGLLDPFNLAQDIQEQKLLAVETVTLMLGKISHDEENALLKAVNAVSEQHQPSLNKVVEWLQNAANLHGEGMTVEQRVAAENLGMKLSTLRGLKYASLCFSAHERVNLSPEDGLTIITLLGLDLPASDQDPISYTWPNRLAVAIMYLISSFTLNLMGSLKKTHPKAVIIDEAWAITSTTQGQAMIPKIARMGRSLNTALVLVSQNAQDFQQQGLTNSMASYMAFRAKAEDEIDGVINLFDLEPTDENRLTIRGLNNGECLFKDADGRIARVQIDAWNEEWQRAFETNPEKKARQLESA